MSLNSLSEQLKLLNEPKIVNDDIEVDDDATLATKVFEVNLNDDDRVNNVNEFSKIRKNQIISLSSINKRYAGKKVKRHEFVDSFENESDEDIDEDDIDEENDIDEDIDEDDIDEENDIEDDIDEESNIEEDLDDEDINEKEQNDKDFKTSINQFDEPSIDNEKDQELNILNDYDEQTKFKAIAVKNQYKIYESLIGLRIKLQKLLTISNRLPFNYTLIDNKNKEILDQTIKGIQKLQKIFLEIDDQIEINDKNKEDNNCQKSGKRKSTDIDDMVLSKRFCSLKEYYPSIIDEWYEKTKFVQSNLKLKKFNFFDVRPSQVIEQILSDKDRLINRTKVKRSQYKIIGDNSENTNNDEHEHIYDDDDFYHTILSQIIENKLNVNQDLLLKKKFTDIQRLRNKAKKNVDTKASKGRKIRYDVHEKLVNFMAPIDTTTWEEKAKDDLFKSLFGNFSMETIDE